MIMLWNILYKWKKCECILTEGDGSLWLIEEDGSLNVVYPLSK